ncbi:MAG: 16S rRNA (uracil(1498)-N(3))-methyltransferase [Oscillospiraceae bacterium]|nr:16S rRNA (uracil(1498)-N(3))-methyltransferase [Oscillospiraceae bacterium]
MIRFFAESSAISGDLIYLTADDFSHIRSLRLRPDERFIVCDGEGTDYICTLSKVEGHALSGQESIAKIIKACPSKGEPNVKCSVFIGLAKGDRMDYAVQKSVELGAHEIKLFPSNRCIAIPKDADKKTIRLQKIATETAKQCGRGIIPQVTILDSFDSAIRQASQAKLPLFFYECEEKQDLKGALGQLLEHSSPDTPHSISILTGPEGGFEPHEVNLAISKGMLVATLGPRILRCETAPAAALAALMFHTGNLS